MREKKREESKQTRKKRKENRQKRQKTMHESYVTICNANNVKIFKKCDGFSSTIWVIWNGWAVNKLGHTNMAICWIEEREASVLACNAFISFTKLILMFLYFLLFVRSVLLCFLLFSILDADFVCFFLPSNTRCSVSKKKFNGACLSWKKEPPINLCNNNYLQKRKNIFSR